MSKRLCCCILLLTFYLFAQNKPAIASFDLIDSSYLATKTADILSEKLSNKTKKIAIWKLNNYTPLKINTDDLINSIDVAIVKKHRFELIQRDKLDLILKEQGLSQTGLIDPQKMKEIGKLHGIDMFIFGEIIQNKIENISNITIILKGIDTETGILSFSAEIPASDKYLKTCVDDMGEMFLDSINKEKGYINKYNVKTVAFWQIDDSEVNIPADLMVNKFSNILVNDTSFKVIDRENLPELLKEQAFGASGLVDSKSAKKFGKLYGVDAFIFGKISSYNTDVVEGSYVSTINATLKMIDVNTAQILWGEELQGSYSESIENIYKYWGMEKPKKEGWIISAAKSAVIPGWGQKHNGETQKGDVFLGWEIITVGVGYYAHTQYHTAWQSYMNAITRADMDKHYSEANTYYNVRNICLYSAIGIWLYNIYDAGINYNPLNNTSGLYLLPHDDKILFGARLVL